MKRLLVYLIVVISLGLTFSFNVEAKTYSSPTEFIEKFNNKSLTIFMKDIDPNQEYKEVSKLIENYFDININNIDIDSQIHIVFMLLL